MTTTYVRTLGSLAPGIALIPARYHPAKEQRLQFSDSIPLGELVSDVRETVSPAGKWSPRDAKFITYDTSDAQDGFLRPKSEFTTIADIGSTKKLFQPGDVLISRLRPYLRQVAFVPPDLLAESGNLLLACSTEFHVLRSKDPQRSVGFLVPYLLSRDVQEVLSLSQEGGHHPRFTTDTLIRLPVPQALVQLRDQISARVEKLASQHHQALRALAQLVLDFSGTSAGAPLVQDGKRKRQ